MPQAFRSGAVTTCFNDLSLSRPGIEPRFPAYEVIALPPRRRSGIEVPRVGRLVGVRI